MPDEATEFLNGISPGDPLRVWTSINFERKALRFLDEEQISYLRKSMKWTFICGIYDGKRRMFCQDYPIQFQLQIPRGFKVFYLVGKGEEGESFVGIIDTAKARSSLAKRLADVSSEASYLAGRFTDGIFNITGR